MKIQKKLGTMLIVLCIISGFFVKLTVKADGLPENIMTEMMAETAITAEVETEIAAKPEAETEITTESEAEPAITTEPEAETDMTTEQDSSEGLQTEKAEESSGAESEIFNEIPTFEACLEYSPQGWGVKGFFKDIAADTILVRPMCSTDGETYWECGQEWNLQWLGSENERELAKLYNQRCLYGSEEPLKSYLAKDLNRFYIKLHVVRKNGISYETQTAVIDRGELQPVSTDIDMDVIFASNVFVREGWPPNIQCYGRYQMTVSEDAANEEITAFLPDTLPVKIQLQKGLDYIGDDVIDCPVKWKTLNIPQLTAGESVTALDAAEEIVIPAGTVLNTQTGIYQLNEPISMKQCGITDEVRIVLNVVAKDGQPAGVLTEENYGLKMAFDLKPTGAVSIRAYTITEDQAEWKELLGLSLTDAVNAQPSDANSGYTVVLEREQEPYRSYRKAQEAEEEPIPFFVGLKIEGGAYDGRQLVLAWPETYELPPDLPKVGGAGGNQGNAGSDDKDDSTEGGQRPRLPQNPESESTPEAPGEPESRLPESGLPKEPLDEAIPAIIEVEILKKEIPEIGMDFSEQQMTSSIQYKSSVQAAIEADVGEENSGIEKKEEIEGIEEMPDGTPDTVAAMDTVSFGYMDEGIRPDIQERTDFGISSVSTKVFFVIAACIVVLGFACIIVLQGTAGIKIVDALRRFFTL